MIVFDFVLLNLVTIYTFVQDRKTAADFCGNSYSTYSSDAGVKAAKAAILSLLQVVCAAEVVEI